MNTTGDFPGENRLEAGEEGHVDGEQPNHPDHEDHHHLHHRQVPQLVLALAPGTECVGLRLCERRLRDVGQDDVRAVAVVRRDGRVDVDGAPLASSCRAHVLRHGRHVGALAQAPRILGRQQISGEQDFDVGV